MTLGRVGPRRRRIGQFRLGRLTTFELPMNYQDALPMPMRRNCFPEGKDFFRSFRFTLLGSISVVT